MKTVDLTYDQIKHLALHCPIQLPKQIGVEIKSGDWLAYPAKNEPVKRLTKAAKENLRSRVMAGTSYTGDLGNVTVGGKLFHLYPKSSALIRLDFAQWMDANADKYIRKDGTFKESNKPLRDKELSPMPIAQHVINAKLRAKEFRKPDCLMHEGNWNPQYDMLKRARDYGFECARDEQAGDIASVTRIQYEMLLALCAFRDRNYRASVDAFINVAALALQSAEYVCNEHGRKTEGAVK